MVSINSQCLNNNTIINIHNWTNINNKVDQCNRINIGRCLKALWGRHRCHRNNAHHMIIMACSHNIRRGIYRRWTIFLNNYLLDLDIFLFFFYSYPPQYGPPQQHGMQRQPYMRNPNYPNNMPGTGPMMPHQMRPRPTPAPLPGTVASVYQGVAEKIGTGIIDDPLEAFNRLMREKERRKEERRIAPELGSPSTRRRSRSPDNRRRSPDLRRRSPRRSSPDLRRNRSPVDKRGRSTGERRSPDDRRRRRSGSFHSRPSRSFSR